jgi:hypothetical protein
MRRFKVEPKNGWSNATRDELQKECANMIADKHCLNALLLYEVFVKLNIYLLRTMCFFTGKNFLDYNYILLDLLLNDDPSELFNLIGTNYEKFEI